MIRLAVLVTCHNRKAMTLASLASLKDAVGPNIAPEIFLVDDGSKDGTAEAVQAQYPNATILRGDGNLYWNGGMRMAWQRAAKAKPDFFLWLNDDLNLRPQSVQQMMETYQQFPGHTIVVGKTVDPTDGHVTYGGYRVKAGLSRLSFRRLRDDEIECHTMNGNCVLFPFSAAADIGVNHEHFTHAFGDNDYGLRATKRGYRVVECKTPVGEQEHNVEYARKTSVLTLQNWRFILLSPKGVPVKEWFQFCMTHGGPLGMGNFLLRYLNMGIKGMSKNS